MSYSLRSFVWSYDPSEREHTSSYSTYHLGKIQTKKLDKRVDIYCISCPLTKFCSLFNAQADKLFSLYYMRCWTYSHMIFIYYQLSIYEVLEKKPLLLPSSVKRRAIYKSNQRWCAESENKSHIVSVCWLYTNAPQKLRRTYSSCVAPVNEWKRKR